MDLIRDKIDKLLLELSSDNLIDIAKNLNIDVKRREIRERCYSLYKNTLITLIKGTFTCIDKWFQKRL